MGRHMLNKTGGNAGVDNYSSIQSTHQNEVDFERIKLLYQAGYNGLLGGLLIIFFFPVFMYNRLDHQILGAWTLLIASVNLPRFFLLRAFQKGLEKNLITPLNVRRWEAYFIAGFCLSGMIWAMIAFLPYRGDIVICLLFAVIVHVGISAVVVSMYSSSKNMVFLYLTVTLIPTYFRILSTNERPLIVVGLIGFAFYYVLLRAVKMHNHNLVEIIRLKIQNDALSKKDALTGLWNRRQLYHFVEKLIPRAVRHNEIFSILLMDIDFFKNYNDTRGHLAGDVLLQKISALLQKSIRQEDLAVRYGGEEFLVVLPQASLQSAFEIGERIRKSIEAETEVTVSAGISSFDPAKSFDQMAKEADELLYVAKESGKNKVAAPSRTPA